MKRGPKVKPVRAWAWVIGPPHGGLCFWAAPTPEQLRKWGKPDSEARMLRVEIRPVPKHKPKRKA